MRKMPHDESMGGLCGSFSAAASKATDICASYQEYLVKIKTVCREGTLAPILAFKYKARQGQTSLCSLQMRRWKSTDLLTCRLQAGWDVGRIQTSHPRTPALPCINSAHFYRKEVLF